MVPVAAEPPTTPLTCQVTAVLLVPVTAAANCVVAPRCVCVAPLTVMVTAVAPELGVEEVEVTELVSGLIPAEQPARFIAKGSTRPMANVGAMDRARSRIGRAWRTGTTEPGME